MIAHPVSLESHQLISGLKDLLDNDDQWSYKCCHITSVFSQEVVQPHLFPTQECVLTYP